MVKLIHNSC